jgi:hypothetical protein
VRDDSWVAVAALVRSGVGAVIQSEEEVVLRGSPPSQRGAYSLVSATEKHQHA